MPRTLVLFQGSGDDVAATAEAVAEGVRSVRFAEVDVRRVPERGVSTSGRVRTLGSAQELATYDGLILGTTADKAENSPAITRLLAEAESLRKQAPLGLLVGAAFATGEASDEACWALLRALGGLGLVLVPPGANGPEARKLGHRVAHVVSWITHARSHHH